MAFPPPSVPSVVPNPWNPLAAWPKLGRWLWLIMAAVMVGQQGPDLVRVLRPKDGKGNDFFQEWSSARYFWTGKPIYSPLGDSIEENLGYRLTPGTVLQINYNAHPPTSVLAILPLGRLNYSDACLAWNLLSIAAYLGAIVLVVREFRLTVSPWAVPACVVVALTCVPVWQQLGQGQWNAVLAFLITAGWACWRRGRLVSAGVFIGTAAALKLFPAFVLIVFLMRRQWRGLAAAAVTGLALTAGTVLTFGIDAYTDYTTKVLPELDRFKGWGANISVPGYIRRLTAPTDPVPRATLETPPDDGQYYVTDSFGEYQSRPLVNSPALGHVLAAFAVGAIVLFTARRLYQADNGPALDRAFGLALVAMLLVSPITWDHYILNLLMPLVLVWAFGLPAGLRPLAFLGALLILWAPHVRMYAMFVPSEMDAEGTITSMSVGPVHLLTLMGLPMAALMTMGALLAWWPKAESTASA